MAMHVLVADDDAVFRDLVCDILVKQGYEVIPAADGEQAIAVFFSRTDVDLVILDVMMPVYDGWEVLREIREHADVPVLMLTALGDERHEVFGLREGADEYIAKPFSYEVFLARVHALLRKVRKEAEELLCAGNLQVSQHTHAVRVQGEEIVLNRKEFNLLVHFMRNPHRVLTREQIIANLWGYDFEGDVRTIDTHIKTLRAKLGACGGYIRTMRGTGYQFEVEQI